MLLKRYSDMSFVMSLDVKTLANLIVKAFEKEAENMIWQKWLVELPYFEKDNFVSFDAYKDKHFQQKESDRKDEEIMRDAENILNMLNEPK